MRATSRGGPQLARRCASRTAQRIAESTISCTMTSVIAAAPSSVHRPVSGIPSGCAVQWPCPERNNVNTPRRPLPRSLTSTTTRSDASAAAGGSDDGAGDAGHRLPSRGCRHRERVQPACRQCALASDPNEIRQLRLDGRRRQAEHQGHLGVLLPEPQQPPLALGHPSRRPGEVDMHQPTGSLQVEPLGRDIGGDQLGRRWSEGAANCSAPVQTLPTQCRAASDADRSRLHHPSPRRCPLPMPF